MVVIPRSLSVKSQYFFLHQCSDGLDVYLLAALLRENAVWLAVATLMISFGNIVGHTILFNIKGKTFYNAGLLTSWLCFAPCIYFFFEIVYAGHLIRPLDYIIGVPLGLILNIVGIVKLIDWMADKKTTYIFEQRNILAKDRQMPL